MRYVVISDAIIAQIDEGRTKVLASTGITPKELCSASDQHLLELQQQLLMGSAWGSLEFCKEWVTPKYRTIGGRTYRLQLALSGGIDPESAIARRIWRELLRFSVALRLWPGRMGIAVKPSTILQNLRDLGHIIRKTELKEAGGFWSQVSRSVVVKQRPRSVLGLLAHYHKMGALPDAPAGGKRKGTQPRRDRTDEPEHVAAVEDKKLWQPFPDAYTTIAGARAIKMMRAVGPTLIQALERAITVPLRVTTKRGGSPLTKEGMRKANKVALDRAIGDWDWRAVDGTALSTFEMKSTDGLSKGPWAPPRTYNDAWLLLSTLQACHFWIVAFSLGGRHGEILGLRENCLRREASQTPTGSFQSWKLDGIQGRQTEVPLPATTVEAIQQQVRLAKLVKRAADIDGDHLWVRMGLRGPGKKGEPLADFDRLFGRFNEVFGLEHYLEEDGHQIYRFRKTLVRVVALALVHAPKILMDILGHRDEQMTVMRYILSDPGILTEIEEVTRELIILKGLDAVTNRDQLQGKAAPIFRERVAQHVKLLGRDALEPQNIREFIEVITEGGGGWAIIGPGKVCTGFRKGGLCNDSKGEANPHYCQPECPNQLQFPGYEKFDGTVTSAILEAIETLDYMVDQLRQSAENGEDMLVAQFAGQIKGLLSQWREVDQHFQSRHLNDPLVKKHFPQVVLLV